MYDALLWLLVVEILGVIALPLTFNLFRRLPDRGLIFSKLLAILLSSYLLWLLGLTHLIPNSRYTIIAILVGLALVSFLVVRRRIPEIVSFIRRERAPLLTGELVFLGFYFLWLSVVSSAPAINHTEKPMDFAFLNSILRSTYFPPEDPWLAGHSISYYYFGHFMMAFLTKLTAIPSSISYNLSIALIPALVAAGAFSLVYNLVRLSGGAKRAAILFALAAPLFLVIIGNLEGVLEFGHARGWGSEGFWQWVSIKGIEGAQQGGSSIFPTDYLWWWRGTRVIDTVVDGVSLDYTITEFPFFSFLLGDLHAHVSSLPFLVLNLALGLNLFVSSDRLGLGWLRRNPWEVFAITLSLGSLAFINIWDFPVFALLLVGLVLVKSYGDWGGRFLSSLLHSLAVVGPVLVGAVVLYIPFYLTLDSQASGVMPVGDASTRPFFFFLVWGLFLLISGSFLVKQLWNVPGVGGLNPSLVATVLVLALLPFLLWAGVQLLALWTGWEAVISRLDGRGIGGEGVVGARFGKVLPGLAMAAIALYSMLLMVKNGGERATAFSMLPLAIAFYLLVGAELFYLVDFFNNRMNTVFKVYYQAWLFLAIVSAYGLYYLWSRPFDLPSIPSLVRRGQRGGGFPSLVRKGQRGGGFPSLVRKGQEESGGDGPQVLQAIRRLPVGIMRSWLRYGWVGLLAVLLAASLYYPVGAALDRTDNFGEGNTFDGLAFLKTTRPGEYEAIKWLRDQAAWGRIVEAVGDDYSEYGRISASTGLPTVLGWKGHEHQWRGSTKPFQGREDLVAQIYRGRDPERVERLLETHDIRYVYLGARERAKYGASQFHEFSAFLEPAFQAEGVVIYQRLSHREGGIPEGDDGRAG